MDKINIKKEVEKAFKAATMATVVTFKSDMAVLTAEVVAAKAFKDAGGLME